MKIFKHPKLKELNNLAIPLIIQSISGLVIGFADQAMIGRISIFAFGAVGVIISLLYLIAGILGSTSISFNISGSKALGKNNEDDFLYEFNSTLLLNIIIGAVFLVLILLLGNPVLKIVYGFTGAILSESIKYFNIMSIYVMLILTLFTFSSFFKIKKDTKWVLIGSTSSSIINLVLNYILIFGKFGFSKLGVQGAAIATILSLFLNVLFYAFICRRYIRFSLKDFNIYKVKMIANLKSSFPLMGQEFLEGSVFIVAINAIITRIGIVEISTYLILCQIINIMLMPMFTYGSSTLTLISHSFGSENKDDLVDTPKIGVFMSSLTYLCLAALFLLLKDKLPGLITENLDVIALASSLMLFAVISNLFHPFCTVYKYSLQSIDECNFVLYSTAAVNMCVLLLMLIMVFALPNKMMSVFISLFLNYLILFIIYRAKYNKCINSKFEYSVAK